MEIGRREANDCGGGKTSSVRGSSRKGHYIIRRVGRRRRPLLPAEVGLHCMVKASKHGRFYGRFYNVGDIGRLYTVASAP